MSPEIRIVLGSNAERRQQYRYGHTFAGDVGGQPLSSGVTGERDLLIDVVDSRADMTMDDDSSAGVCRCCTHVTAAHLQRRTFHHYTWRSYITLHYIKVI